MIASQELDKEMLNLKMIWFASGFVARKKCPIPCSRVMI